MEIQLKLIVTQSGLLNEEQITLSGQVETMERLYNGMHSLLLVKLLTSLSQ